MKFESESQLSVRCFKCGCFGHRGFQCDDFLSGTRSQSLGPGGMLEKCWICGFLGHRAADCKEKMVTCFSCGQRGHKQEDCISPMANCWNCGKRGHIKKNCPVKMNVGMCFYCHEVGHHSKDCDKKLCYICGSKDHLLTSCPLKGTQGFPASTSGYIRQMQYMPPVENHQKPTQLGQFPNQLPFNGWCYQSLENQQQTPQCLRPNSMPLLLDHDRTSDPERPFPLRTNSVPDRYSGYFKSLERTQMGQSMDDFDLVPNHSSWSSVTPRTGFVGLRSDQESSGFSMTDVFSRSNESLMRMTESEKQCRSLMLPLCGRRSSVESSVTPRESLPESLWDTGLHAASRATQAGLVMNPPSEKQAVNSEHIDIDPLSREVNRLAMNTPVEKQGLTRGYNAVDLTDNEPKGLMMNKLYEKKVVTSEDDATDLLGNEANGSVTKIFKKQVLTSGYHSFDLTCSEAKGSLTNKLGAKQSVTTGNDWVNLANREAKGSVMSTLIEKPEGTSGDHGVDLPEDENKKDCGEKEMKNCGDGDTPPLQNQQTLQPAHGTQATSPDVSDVHNAAWADATVDSTTEVMNSNLSPTTTSRSNTDSIARVPESIVINTMKASSNMTSPSTRDSSDHIVESALTMSIGRQEDAKDQVCEVTVPEASIKTSYSLESCKTEARVKTVCKTKAGVKTHENSVQEDLKRVRKQLAEAKTELNEKREQLDKTKKIVEHLRNFLFLESSFKKKFCSKNYQEDVGNRCPNCIQILKNVESCEVCMCISK